MNHFLQPKIVSAAMCILALTSCNELLPARDDLNGLFTTSVSSGFYRTGGVNYIRFYVTVKNTTDEVIEERADISGVMDIRWLPFTEGHSASADLKRTFILNKSNIFRADGYSASTGILRMIPNDSIVLYVYWNMRSNDSTFLPQYWTFVNDNQCDVLYANGEVRKRRIYNRQYFSVSASVKLFDRLAILYAAPMTVGECYVMDYVVEVDHPPKDPCVNINIYNPCSRIDE